MSGGFNDAVNGFSDDGWSLMSSDGVEDVTIVANSSPSKLPGRFSTFCAGGGGILCAKASMLLQNVPPAQLVRFLREHRSEWADCGIDAFSATTLKGSPFGISASWFGGFPGGVVALPVTHTSDREELLEVIRVEGHGFHQEAGVPGDTYLLQLCSGIDENTVGTCAQLVFAPVDESFADEAPLLPSGFRVIPLESRTDLPAANRTLDLASALEVGSAVSRSSSNAAANEYSLRSVLTIAFQFTYENHLQDNVAMMARQYVRSVISSVQRVAMAITPSCTSRQVGPKSPPGSPDAVNLATWISRSYTLHTGMELLKPDGQGAESILKLLWYHTDAIMCCSLATNASPVFTFANQGGLHVLETTLVALEDLVLDKVLDENGRKALCTEFPNVMQQGFAYLPAGICRSSTGRPVSYEQGVVWKVFNDDEVHHCLAFMFINWCFL